MAERIKDAEDRFLESVFESDAIRDDGFSGRIVARIRRRLWVRRLALPVATIIGGAIAFKPLAAVVALAAKLTTIVPVGTVSTAVESIPQFQTFVLGGILLAAGMFALKLLED